MNRQFVEEYSDLTIPGLLARELDYWRIQLGGDLPKLNLMLDYPRPIQPTSRGESHSFWLTEEMYQSLNLLCRKEKITTFMLLLTVLQVLLHRYTDQEDILVGSLIAGRSHPDFEPLLTSFTNTLVIRTPLQAEMSVREAMHRVRAVAMEAYYHQNLPYSKLVAELNPSNSENPYFRIMLNMKTPDILNEDVDLTDNPGHVDLTLNVTELAGRLKCTMVYNTDVFRLETIVRMEGHFQTLLAGFINNPEAILARVPLITKQEEHQLLVEWNTSLPLYPQGLSVNEIFVEQVNLSPNSVALVYQDQNMTYLELNQRANQIANYLRGLGLGHEGLVAVCLDRSPDLIAVFLGILKAGGAYVPLDITYPKERIAWMLDNSKVSFLITTANLAELLPATNAKVICLDNKVEAIVSLSLENPINTSGANELAYVIYTSGTTGKPKGVAIEHQGIIRLLKKATFARMGPEETFLSLSTVAFDASIIEIYGALLNGGRLVLMDSNKPSLGQIAETISQQSVTILFAGPELLNVLLEDYEDFLVNLNQIMCGGEALPTWVAEKCYAKLSNCELINCYGPTENAVITLTSPVKKNLYETSIPIGRPIAGDSIYILDSYLQPVPIGVVGELYVSGDGIARGYLNNAELTQERFIANPFFADSKHKLYKTGDLARYRSDGNVEFFGRADSQVKIRGNRVELGEIEIAVSLYPGILQAIAAISKHESGSNQLTVYIVMKKEMFLEQLKLRAFLQDRLPQFMLPTFIIELTHFPLTPSGKIDRKSLPIPNVLHNIEQRIGARDAVEAQLVLIWENLLGIEAIGVTDNFFDLGGHSLLAMRMFAEIEKVFRKKLSVSLIFKEDTIEKLAKMLQTENMEDELSSSIVVMQPFGEKSALFIVHEFDGELISYRNLINELGVDRPIIGLRDTRQDNGTRVTIQQLAAKYVQEISRVQQAGPYYLIGFSIGGLIAYEMAQLLKQANHEVALLGILDEFNPKFPPAQLTLMTNLSDNIVHLVKKPWNQKVPFLLEKVQHLLGKKKLFPTSQDDEIESRAQHLLKAAEAYRPEPYSDKLVLFCAEGTVYSPITNGKYGWEITEDGSMDVYEVPGNHQTLLADFNVNHVVKHLKGYLLGLSTLPISSFDYFLNY